MNYKKITLALFLLVGGIASSKAQDIKVKDVPAAIRTTFAKQYPKATDVDWELKGGNYEVDFDLGKSDHKVTYATDGKVVSVEKELLKSQLPTSIAKAVKSKYPKGRVDGVTWISTAGKVTYKVDIEGVPDVNAWYDASGKFLKEIPD
jgi:hypothetical protein